MTITPQYFTFLLFMSLLLPPALFIVSPSHFYPHSHQETVAAFVGTKLRRFFLIFFLRKLPPCTQAGFDLTPRQRRQGNIGGILIFENYRPVPRRDSITRPITLQAESTYPYH
jgi:hypothetical protein